MILKNKYLFNLLILIVKFGKNWKYYNIKKYKNKYLVSKL